MAKYVAQFTEYYESQGYTVTRLNAVTSGRKVITGGQQALFAAKDLPLLGRIWDYFTGIVDIDNIHKAAEVEGERGLTFTLFDPLYGGINLPQPSSATARSTSTCCILTASSPLSTRISPPSSWAPPIR